MYTCVIVYMSTLYTSEDNDSVEAPNQTAGWLKSEKKLLPRSQKLRQCNSGVKSASLDGGDTSLSTQKKCLGVVYANCGLVFFITILLLYKTFSTCSGL